MLKAIAQKLYNIAFSVDEQQKNAIAQLNHGQRQEIAHHWFNNDAIRLYTQTDIDVASVYICNLHAVVDLDQFAKRNVQAKADDKYFITNVIKRIINGDVKELLNVLNDSIEIAKNTKNFVKRRSIIREAVKVYYPNLTTDQSVLVAELILSL